MHVLDIFDIFEILQEFMTANKSFNDGKCSYYSVSLSISMVSSSIKWEIIVFFFSSKSLPYVENVFLSPRYLLAAMGWGSVAALHQGAPGQVTWLEDPPPNIYDDISLIFSCNCETCSR